MSAQASVSTSHEPASGPVAEYRASSIRGANALAGAAPVAGARMRIVEGAVGMVQLALQRLKEEDVVELDEERKASMVSNLMVVLCGEQPPSPVVNTGTLYS